MPCMPAVPLEFGHYLTSFILQHTQFLDRGQIKSHRHVPRGLPKMETVEPISNYGSARPQFINRRALEMARCPSWLTQPVT
jgi:hypothetical protein